MIALVLLGCPKAAVPSLYPLPLPELDHPAPLAYEPAPDTCDGPEPVIAGEPPPLSADGLATCGGILIGDDEYAELMWSSDVALPWYRSYAIECADGRARDRAWGDAAARSAADERRALEQQNRAFRATGPLLFVGGVVVGAVAVGVATSVEVSVVR